MEKIKILVNSSTLVTGGGIQVGLTFIEYAFECKDQDLDFVFVVSKPIFDNLPQNFKSDNRIVLCAVSPSGILSGRKSRKLLKQIEQRYKPDLIYSLGFPSYVLFKTREIGRYTNPWEINNSPLPWHIFSVYEKIKTFLSIQYKLVWARRADFFETQTEAAKRGIMRKLGVPEHKIQVIPNSPNPIFSSSTPVKSKKGIDIMIFCLSAPYRHKNLTIIPKVANHLKSRFNLDCVFLTTISENSLSNQKIKESAEELGVSHMIRNLGSLNLQDCAKWYQKSDIVFLPTLLEVFSATYVEAMAMKKPIITTDLEFAHDVCGQAALYYNPYSPQDAAEKIMELVNSRALQKALIQNGEIKLKSFPNTEEKCKIIFNRFRELSKS